MGSPVDRHADDRNAPGRPPGRWPGASLALQVAVALAVAAAAGFGVNAVATRFLVSQAEARVEDVLLTQRGLHRYIQEVMHPEFYGARGRGDIARDFYAPQLFSSTFMARGIHALYNEERERAGLEPIYYKLASENPRNPVNRADARERELLRRFNADRSLGRAREIVTIDGRQYLEYAIPFLETGEACLRCHGKREDAPPGLASLYPEGGGFGETGGTIRALESIRVPIGGELRTAWALSGAIGFGALSFAALALSRAQLRRRVRERTVSLTAEVAERRRAEEEVLRLKDELSGVIEAMPSALVGLDGEGRVALFNRAAEALSGVPAGAALGRPVAALLPAMGAQLDRLRARPGRGDGGLAAEHAVVERDGVARAYELLHYPLAVEGVQGGVIRIDDVTDRTELEKQLAQTQRLEAIGTLAGGIAHDFNNILSAIEGYATLVLEQPIPPEVREDVRSILDAARRATALTRQILAFSRPAVSQEPRLVSASAIVREALRMLRATIPASIELRTRLGSDAVIRADPSDLHRVLVNLCTNASLAMKGGGLLEVELDEAPAAVAPPGAGRWLRLAVRDSGRGMTPEVKARIFEPFFTTRKDEGGTGMGLATVHGIVKRLGGAISVESEPGAGSTFTILLPIADAAERGEQAPERAGLRGDERILFVDDEPAVCRVAGRSLSALGYRVGTFTSAAEALAALEAAPADWDVLVTDTTMPGLTGDVLARRAKALRPELPVVLCTGYSERIAEGDAAALGVDRFVLKPISGAELSRLVRALVDGRRA